MSPLLLGILKEFDGVAAGREVWLSPRAKQVGQVFIVECRIRLKSTLHSFLNMSVLLDCNKKDGLKWLSLTHVAPEHKQT